MRLDAARLVVSATDLANFLGCRRRTALEIGEAYGKRKRPAWNDPVIEALFRRGIEHERRYVESLEAEGRQVVRIPAVADRAAALAATVEAMRGGADVIVQGALGNDRWFGRPDLLVRVGRESTFGGWAYEAADTKLAVETRAGTILQLGLYCDLLAAAQGCEPAGFQVVIPDPRTPSGFEVQRYRVDHYAAYFRLLRRKLEAAVGGDDETLLAESYPEPVEHCDICPWSSQCSRRRREDDHLSLVAGISRVQRAELQANGIHTVAALAAMPLPFAFKPSRGATESLVRAREQARVQVEARGAGRPVHEPILPLEAGKGLCRLPAPSPGDLFFDIEGDPLAGSQGREYLFGLVSVGPDGAPRYEARWAMTEGEEARAFDEVVTRIMDGWAADPGMHVYHYAPYEPGAMKRLMGRFARREQEIDRLLRSGRFVDLYAIVRQGIRAGVERYSIKALEPLYGFERQVPLADAGRALMAVEQALELGLDHQVADEIRALVLGYNKDDCLSALRLRDWLESVRTALEAGGHAVPRPEPRAAAAPGKIAEREARVADLRARLLDGMPTERASRDRDQQARWLLAYLLDWHRREDKAAWWEYFRLRDLPEEDLFEEPRAAAGLEFVARVEEVRGRSGRPTKSVVDRYRYPVQEMELRRGDELKQQTEEKFGTVERVGRRARTIDIRKGPKTASVHPRALFEHKHIAADVIEDALFDIGQAVARGEGATLALRLLRRDPPSTASGTFARRDGEPAVDFAVRTALELTDSVLAIHGPPGAGKTYAGAQMICALVARGKRVGVTATGHAVIRNLLDAVATEAVKTKREDLRLGHKVDDEEEEPGPVAQFGGGSGNAEALDALSTGRVNVLGGTAWLWSRPELAASVDVLFVDEAGQMSLANVLACTRATGSLVMLGDPQQLEQPKKGTHPDGVGMSVLQHMLGAHETMPERQGIFLPETWRLPPSIAEFTSELFYEKRLRSRTGLDRQRLAGGPFEGNGLWLVEVAHDGNRSASDEEVAMVSGLVDRLLAPGSTWVDESGVTRPLDGKDILVVAPFNAQVSRLADALERRGVPVGTVDKFQGQEAPVVIYSMATSAPEDAPRGLEFLYSLNRLNVATSRARCAAVIVASPRLFEPDCRTPRQIRLANALCRFRELAGVM